MRKMILLCWRIIDPIYFFFTRLQYIQFGENIFRVRLTIYKGHTIQLSNGTTINKNDLLLKIHFHNVKFLSDLNCAKSDFQKGKMFYHTVRQSLPALAHFLQNHPEHNHIKGLIGISSLHFKNNFLGFETFKIHNIFYKKFKWVSFLPINLLSSNISGLKSYDPQYFIMAKDVLLDKYLPKNIVNESIPMEMDSKVFI